MSELFAARMRLYMARDALAQAQDSPDFCEHSEQAQLLDARVLHLVQVVADLE